MTHGIYPALTIKKREGISSCPLILLLINDLFPAQQTAHTAKSKEAQTKQCESGSSIGYRSCRCCRRLKREVASGCTCTGDVESPCAKGPFEAASVDEPCAGYVQKGKCRRKIFGGTCQVELEKRSSPSNAPQWDNHSGIETPRSINANRRGESTKTSGLRFRERDHWSKRSRSLTNRQSRP